MSADNIAERLERVSLILPVTSEVSTADLLRQAAARIREQDAEIGVLKAALGAIAHGSSEAFANAVEAGNHFAAVCNVQRFARSVLNPSASNQ